MRASKNIRVLKFFFSIYFFLYEFNFVTFIRSSNLIRNLRARRGERIFDAGCGIGLNCLRIANKHALVVGGDLNASFKYSLYLGSAAPRALMAAHFIYRYCALRCTIMRAGGQVQRILARIAKKLLGVNKRAR